jgi:tRNA(fMet)-specific endonuclease VapC
MARLVLDADTITYILQRRPTVVARLAAAVRENSEVYLCPVVYYQVRRGLLAKQAQRQLLEFEAFAQRLTWIDVPRPVWADAALLWARVRAHGRPHDDDGDLLIAAYARWLQATVVTNNVRDFAALDVTCVTWTD